MDIQDKIKIMLGIAAEAAFKKLVQTEREAILTEISKRVPLQPSDWCKIDEIMSVMFAILLDLHRDSLKVFMMAMDANASRDKQRVEAASAALSTMPASMIQASAIASILTAHFRILGQEQRMNTAHIHLDKVARVAKECDDELTVAVLDKDGLHPIRGD